MSDDNTQDGAEQSVASAGSHGHRCRCGLATRLVGDGCEECNPAMMIDILREQVADMRLAVAERCGELAKARLTDEERCVIWTVAEAYAENDGDPECERIARIMQGLWQRTK